MSFLRLRNHNLIKICFQPLRWLFTFSPHHMHCISISTGCIMSNSFFQKRFFPPSVYKHSIASPESWIKSVVSADPAQIMKHKKIKLHNYNPTGSKSRNVITYKEKPLEENTSVGFINFQTLLLVLKQSKTTDFQTQCNVTSSTTLNDSGLS